MQIPRLEFNKDNEIVLTYSDLQECHILWFDGFVIVRTEDSNIIARWKEFLEFFSHRVAANLVHKRFMLDSSDRAFADGENIVIKDINNNVKLTYKLFLSRDPKEASKYLNDLIQIIASGNTWR